MSFISNSQLDLAFEYVRNTNKNIFLTGKAGTGKTTFPHKIKEEAPSGWSLPPQRASPQSTPAA